MKPERLLPLLAAPSFCVSCGGSVRALHVFPVNHNKRRVTKQLSLALLGCEGCGLAFSVPSPTAEELDAYYGSEGRGWDRRITADPAKLAAKLGRKGASNAKDYGLLVANVELPAGERRALDFGCGIGAWLDVLAADGWETAGIEPGVRAAAAAGARHRILAEIPREPSFELVVVHHTLEHLVDPLAVLRLLANATTEGGLLCVSVPNFSRLPEHGDFTYIASDKHVSSYTSPALCSLFALAGFEVVADSNDPSWNETVVRQEAVKRLVCIGRRRAGALALPEEPLRAATAALRAYARKRPLPERPVSTSRRVLRRLRRLLA